VSAPGAADAAAPPDVLVQQWVVQEQGDPFGRRVREDGTVEECTSATAAFEDGEWRMGTQPLAWREVGRLGPEALDGLRGQIRALGLLGGDGDGAGEPKGTHVAKAVQTWTVALDGRRREHAVAGAGLGSAPALAKLDEALQMALARAQEP
jgi:hypothetical protein